MTKLLLITWVFLSSTAFCLRSLTPANPCMPEKHAAKKTMVHAPLDFLK
jgi:hypothetical protein